MPPDGQIAIRIKLLPVPDQVHPTFGDMPYSPPQGFPSTTQCPSFLKASWGRWDEKYGGHI